MDRDRLRFGIQSALAGGALVGVGVIIGMRVQKAPDPPPAATPGPLARAFAPAPHDEAPVERRLSPALPAAPDPAAARPAPRPAAAPRPPIPVKVSDAQRAAVVRRWGRAAPMPETSARLDLPQRAATALARVGECDQVGDRGCVLEMYQKAQLFTPDPGQRDLVRFAMTSVYDEAGEDDELVKLLDEIGRTATRLDVQAAASDWLDAIDRKRKKP